MHYQIAKAAIELNKQMRSMFQGLGLLNASCYLKTFIWGIQHALSISANMLMRSVYKPKFGRFPPK